MPRLKGTLKLLDGNVCQERCNMVLDVFHGLPMFSFQLSLESGKQKKVAWSQVGTVRGVGDHRGVAPGQEVGSDEGRVAGGIVMVELDRVFNVSPRA